MPAVVQLADGSLDVSLLLGTLTAFKKGDFSVRMPLDWTGMAGKVTDALNGVIETTERMSRELARLSQVVGREGKLSQRASLGDAAGSWAEDANSINALLEDLASPASETARVIGAVARGDLSQTMALERDGEPLKGSVLQTTQTINTMVDQLRSFASEVTRVAREVGADGKLGGQASVPGAAGTWKDLTDRVNRLATSRSTQVRAIAEVTTAVTKGDLTRSIQVEASGEVASLKDNINQMISYLVSMRARWGRTIKGRFAPVLVAEPEVAGGEDEGNGSEVLGWNAQDGSPRGGLAPQRKSASRSFRCRVAAGACETHSAVNIRREFEKCKPKRTLLLTRTGRSPAPERIQAETGEDGLTQTTATTLRRPARKTRSCGVVWLDWGYAARRAATQGSRRR